MGPTRTLLLAVMASLSLGRGSTDVLAAPPNAKASGPRRPEIRKLGTLDLDMVEATPVVFKDRLYRFGYVRKDYKPNTSGDSHFRFIDVATGEPTSAFAHGYDLGCACTEGGSMWTLILLCQLRRNALGHGHELTRQPFLGGLDAEPVADQPVYLRQ
jgi:hypothetical protein